MTKMESMVVVTRGNLLSYRLNCPSESVKAFDEKHLKRFGVFIPEELLEKYQKVMREYNKLQNELRYYYNSSALKDGL